MKKKKSISVVGYGSLAHHLKSPLASMQSLLFIAERQAKKDNASVALQKTLTTLQEKIGLLNKRILQVVSYTRLHEDDPEFLYSFFRVHDVLAEAAVSSGLEKCIQFTNTLQTEMMGDREVLTTAFSGIFMDLQSVQEDISVTGTLEKGKITLEFQAFVKKGNEESYSESGVEQSLILALAYLAISQHGGSVSESILKGKRVVRVVLPQRVRK